MKFLLIVSLCAFGALADDSPYTEKESETAEPVFDPLMDPNLASSVLWFMQERAKMLRRREGIQDPDVSDIYIPEPHEITAEDLRDDYLEEENDGESADGTKRTLTCKDGFEGDGTRPRTSVIQTQISKLEGIRDLLNYRKGMLRKKLKLDKEGGMPIAEWIMRDDTFDLTSRREE